MDAISYSYADKQAKRIKKFIENPDSTSGVLTQPSVIQTGETVTVPAGRTAILANVQVDGNLNIEGDVFIPTGATFSKVVGTEGVQTISDVKTFTSSPIVPTPTTGTQAVNKDYVDSIALPIGTILNAYTIFNNCIVAFGGEFNRADYPKLWAYLQANPSLVKTQAQWTTENTTNGMCGFFSEGNGTTTFRVPNLDKAFLRPDNRGVGSYQGDELKTHSHNINSYSGSNTTLISYTNAVGGSVLPTAKTFETGGIETRPKNIAVLPLIVAK